MQAAVKRDFRECLDRIAVEELGGDLLRPEKANSAATRSWIRERKLGLGILSD